MKKKITIFMLLAALTGCIRQSSSNVADATGEDLEAKRMFQGVWMEEESGEISLRVKGDTIYYADSTSLPAYFCIQDDSLILASGTKYGIVKQTDHLFWLNNQNGDVVKLSKSDDEIVDFSLVHDNHPRVLTYTHQVKTDSVVTYNGERYHWYIAINPTKYRVVNRTFNEDGLEVENVYYDNIMHVSVYKGANCLFSSDFRKHQYDSKVPKEFLEEAVLGNMEYSYIDSSGLHFNATLCIPDGASCYLVESLIDFHGKMTMKLLEY